jgi:RNA polymerase sigma-70 factor (ECF subfamily)
MPNQDDDEAQAAVESPRARERAAFATLVEAYQQPLGSYLLHLVGDLDTALTLTRQTFVWAYRDDAITRPELAVHAWLYRVATRLAMRHLRRRGSTLKLWSQPEHAISVPPGAPAEERHLVDAVLRDLPLDERSVLLLCEFQQLPHDEVAIVLGSSIELVRQRLAQARARFRLAYLAHDALAWRCFDRPSAAEAR